VIDFHRRLKQRKPKSNPKVRCCWLCGLPGGNGATTALAFFGYEIKPGEIAYAHPDCMIKLQKKQEK
jgi:hypothetical protein